MESPDRRKSRLLVGLIFVAVTLVIFISLTIATLLMDDGMQSTRVLEMFSDFDGDGDTDFIIKADVVINGDSPLMISTPIEVPVETPIIEVPVETPIIEVPVETPIIQYGQPIPTSTATPTIGSGGQIDRNGDFNLSPGWPFQVTQWERDISDAAREFYIDPDIIASIIMKESQGQASITGRDGERGLMQIMPRYHSCATYEPRANIFCGTSILAGHIQYYSGDISTALAAYNAGRQNLPAGVTYANTVLGNMNYYVAK